MISKTIGYNGVHDIFRHTHTAANFGAKHMASWVSCRCPRQVKANFGISFNSTIGSSYKPQVWRQLGQTWFILQWICGHHPCLFLFKNKTGCKGSRYPRWYWSLERNSGALNSWQGWCMVAFCFKGLTDNSWLQTVQWNYAPAERNLMISPELLFGDCFVVFPFGWKKRERERERERK